MKFEKIYKKYQDGTATEEEIKYVEKEIKKAKSIIEQLEVKEKCDLEKTDNELLVNAQKKFDKYIAIKTILVSIISIGIVGLLVTLAVFVIAILSANKNMEFTINDAVLLAESKIENVYDVDIDKFIVEEKDKELDIELNLIKSYYVYEIEFDNGSSEYKVHVNASTGDVKIIDIEGARDIIDNIDGRDNNR